MADYDVNALTGTVYGIVGTGVALHTLGRMTNMVFDSMPRQTQNRRGYKKHGRPKTVYVQKRNQWCRIVYVPYRR
jgi:hypothetical protein